MRYMLDTNICIYLIKQHPPQVLRRLEVLPLGSAVMSVVTYAELRVGLEMPSIDRDRDHDEHALSLLIHRIPVLPFTEADAERFGELRPAVRDRSRNVMDRLIAAHAVNSGVILVTNKEADFKDYPGLMVENWALSS
ncbi:type II toxin-antitoxin system VapC family toxin [Rhodoferax sp.]|uniref:type II toxin-antitoxin system VapC family toxin n=1 Tax=Rhodoferax sp. TaxID=50421 RepID=UPI002718CAC4|nr:type II toxin-antitoxin system VapC family toxin [Rhodoferax sp.]MDO8319849.1 type II toxin-antitoxin system VapC family toxin [Rhodoferax sp.]